MAKERWFIGGLPKRSAANFRVFGGPKRRSRHKRALLKFMLKGGVPKQNNWF